MICIISSYDLNRRSLRGVSKTAVHLPSFKGHFQTGLVFSLIEALNAGEELQILCDQPTQELERLLREAKLPDLEFSTHTAGAGLWSLTIEKKE